MAAFLSLIAMAIACIINVLARSASALFACVYLVALVAWPFTGPVGSLLPPETQWTFFLIDIAIGAALVAFRLPLQIVWAIAAPFLYGFARVAQSGFAPDAWLPVASEVSFALLLGGALVALAWTIRSAAANVDIVRGEAVASYARAAAEGGERERARRRRGSHARQRARRAARGGTGAHPAGAHARRRDGAGGARGAAARRRGRRRCFGRDRRCGRRRGRDRARGAGAGYRPQGAAGVGRRSSAPPGPRRARVVLAAMQAVANAVQHADGVGLTVAVRGRSAPDAVVVVVSDRGRASTSPRFRKTAWACEDPSSRGPPRSAGTRMCSLARRNRRDDRMGERRPMVSVRTILIVIGVAFTTYLGVRGLLWSGPVTLPWLLVVTVILYLATCWLWIFWGSRMPRTARIPAPPVWASVLALTVALVVPNLAFASVPADALRAPYVTWVLGGIGALMTIVVVQRRPVIAGSGWRP